MPKPMKKVLVLLVLAAAVAVYVFVIRPSEKRACARVDELCGLGESTVQQCTQTLDSLKQTNASSAERATTCLGGAKSCGEAMGCVSGAALDIGAGFVKGFLDGLGKAAK
jgi:hypothetical protein